MTSLRVTITIVSILSANSVNAQGGVRQDNEPPRAGFFDSRGNWIGDHQLRLIYCKEAQKNYRDNKCPNTTDTCGNLEIAVRNCAGR